MVQIRWENISEKAQIFHFPKLIEILQCDRYFLKKVKICPLGHLIHAHHGTVSLVRVNAFKFQEIACPIITDMTQFPIVFISYFVCDS